MSEERTWEEEAHLEWDALSPHLLSISHTHRDTDTHTLIGTAAARRRGRTRWGSAPSPPGASPAVVRESVCQLLRAYTCLLVTSNDHCRYRQMCTCFCVCVCDIPTHLSGGVFVCVCVFMCVYVCAYSRTCRARQQGKGAATCSSVVRLCCSAVEPWAEPY